MRSCGLDVDSMLTVWEVLERGTAVWLGTGDLRALVLEVYDQSRPQGDDLVGRFDFTIDYGYAVDGDGTAWPYDAERDLRLHRLLLEALTT